MQSNEKPFAGTELGLNYWIKGKLEAFGLSDTGMVRENNQDSFCVDFNSGVYLVADGMGGRAGGEVASQLAVTWINWELSRKLEMLMSRDMTSRRATVAQAINVASLKIYERSLELPQFRGMGTTSTLLWIPPPSIASQKLPTTAIIAHVGDSRCYLLRSGLLYQITEDHSLVHEQIKSGLLKKSDPLATQIRNVITRCVGYQEEEEVDTFALDLLNNDRFLLCSDGLTNKVHDTEILEKLSQPDLRAVPGELIALANKRGGEDNITAIVVSVI
jgi:serine/threonine protein phosphatase PrpC